MGKDYDYDDKSVKYKSQVFKVERSKREEEYGHERRTTSTYQRHHDRDDRSNRDRDRDRDRERDRDKRYRVRDEERSRPRSRSREKHVKRRSSRSRSRSRSKKHHKESHGKRQDKKERARSSSSSSSGSDNDNSSDDESKVKKGMIAENIAKEELERLEKLERERIRLKEEKKKQKELIKSMETPEQKRLRRLAKKEMKEKKRKQLMGWDEEYMGYTNADNPFGDANLHGSFVWKKKYEKDGIKEINEAEIEKMNKMKMKMNKEELEKVKQRRLEREREKEQRMEDMSKMQREKEAAQFMEWEKQEDHFHLKQAKLRSQLRIQEGRAKPIDMLARYINAFGANDNKEDGNEARDRIDDSFDVTLVEPYLYLNGLRISDLEDLNEDIKVYMSLDSESNQEYWKDLLIIVVDELFKLKQYKAENAMERREGINAQVSNEVLEVFRGKTPAQLQTLQLHIEKKIHSKDEGIDIGYWESLLSKLKAHMARARLKERHADNMQMKLMKMRLEQGEQVKENDEDSNDRPLFPCIFKDEHESSDNLHQELAPYASSSTDTHLDINTDIDLTQILIEEYETGRYSPILIPSSDTESSLIIIDQEEDAKRLGYARDRLLNPASAIKNESSLSHEELKFEREARKGMNEDEVGFSVEEPIKQDKSFYSWSDKYRPRKPRYFNRVHTGFEWNKYNQTHYDIDNPPPKVVQGYKFNIFYPDLIDKGRTPTFKITPCKDNRDFGLIRFTAGPPYEDICFKIVNREWNYSYKSGFRSQFQNNILQLWFHFKRYRYRR